MPVYVPVGMCWKRKRLPRSLPLDEMMRRTINDIGKVNGRAVQNARIFNSNLLKKIRLRQYGLFADVRYCYQLSWSPSLPRRQVHIGVRQSADWQSLHPKSGVCRRTRALVWDRQVFSVKASESDWFFRGWNASMQIRKLYRWRRSEYGVWQFFQSRLTHNTMGTAGVDNCVTSTSVSFT